MLKREFTATVYIFHKDKVLLHKHKKFNKWLPPGGHMEPNETPVEAAKREVLEETNLEIVFIEQENLQVDCDHARSITRPFLCLLETIPETNDQPAHEHIDFIFLANPLKMTPIPKEFQWFKFEELKSIEIFSDTAQVLNLVLGQLFIQV